MRDKDLQHVVEVFNKPNASPDEIAEAGEAFLLSLYPGDGKRSLGEKRF